MKAFRIVAFLLLAPAGLATAQDLVVANARVVDGTGRTIEGGTIVVRAGRITLVTTDAVDPGGAVVLDVRGRTVLPGLIDTHRHDLLGELQDFASLEDEGDVAAAVDRETPRRLRRLLAGGFTTVMLPGMYLSAATEVRERLEDGRIAGPRLLFSGPGFCAPGDFPTRGMVCQDNAFCSENVAFQVVDAREGREHVNALADAGVDAIKIFVDGVGNDLDDDVFAALCAEARSRGLPVLLHAHRVEDVLDGVRLGVDRLVHTPGDRAITDEEARTVRERGVAVATTVSFGSPQFAEAAG